MLDRDRAEKTFGTKKDKPATYVFGAVSAARKFKPTQLSADDLADVSKPFVSWSNP
jgi:hypothetical protein